MKRLDPHFVDPNPDYKPWTYYVLKGLSIIGQVAIVIGAYLLGKFKKSK